MEKRWSSSYNGQQTNILTGSAVLDNVAPNTFYKKQYTEMQSIPIHKRSTRWTHNQEDGRGDITISVKVSAKWYDSKAQKKLPGEVLKHAKKKKKKKKPNTKGFGCLLLSRKNIIMRSSKYFTWTVSKKKANIKVLTSCEVLNISLEQSPKKGQH